MKALCWWALPQANLLSYIQTYLNYANTAGASANKTKLKKVQSKQKDALRMIFNQSKSTSYEPLFLSLNVLNVSQINILQSEQFMDEIKNKNTPYTFLKLFFVPCLSRKLLFNKLSSTTKIPKNFLVCSIRKRTNSLKQLSLKKRKRNW